MLIFIILERLCSTAIEDFSESVICSFNHLRLGERELPKRIISQIMLALLLISMLTLAFNIQPASAGTIIVPDDYSTIQEAINIANPGDTVFVRNGTYLENVIINKSVTLVGESKDAIISQNYTYATLEITENDVTVEGFTIQNYLDSFDPPPIPCGIFLNLSSECQIRDNELGGRYWTSRLVISGGSRNRVEKNRMQSGIYVFGGSENSIEKNVVEDDSIIVSGSTLNVIMQNTVRSQYNTLELTGSNHNYILYNSFCTFCFPSNLCVLMLQSNNNTIEGNTMVDESFEGISRMDLWASCNNSFFHNNFGNFAGVNVSVDEDSKHNVWDDGYPSGGNKWIDYDGQDVYGGRYQNETGSDGIGDTPYVLNEHNQDNYPLMKTWTPVENLNTSVYYSTIQEAINAQETLNGHAISVPSRTHHEHLVVNKSVSLIGANRKNTIIDGNREGNVVEITASNVKITGFTIRNSDSVHSKCGICVNCSNGNKIFNNILTDNARGLCLHNSLNNSISGNVITANNSTGIYLKESSSNVVRENNITSNNEGVYLSDSSSNKFYHNNFMNNVKQIYDRSWDHPEFPHSIDTWDDGYPSGGNYWSDYIVTANDTCRGPYQNITGLDGIGDTPYIIDENNTDNYPLMHPSYVHPSVHNIDTGLDYFTIQDAINAQETTNGHTIKVDKGTYYENILVNKSVSLVGENKHDTIIDGNFTDNVVVITADNVNVTGFTIRNAGEALEPDTGVRLENLRNCNITNNIIINNCYGILLKESGNNTIADNQVFCAQDWLGIALYHSSNYNTLTNNTISSGYMAILLSSSDYNMLNGNKLYSNTFGIRLANSCNNTIVANKISHNTAGIHIASYHSPGINNLVYHNNFVNNTYQATDHNTTNIWHSGYPSGGNYWGDYNGTDMYRGPFQNITGGDGIGDTPYVTLYLNSSDQYPLMNPYGFPLIKTVPEIVELETGYVVGQNFTVAIVVENVTNLYAFNVEFNWNTTYLEYLSHTTTVPVEDYQHPIPPSPYAGILHESTMKLKDAVDEDGIPDAEPGTMAWIAYSSALPARSFSGSGTICVFTFRVKAQSIVDVEVPLHFIVTDLCTSVPSWVPHAMRDGLIKIPRLPPDIAITNVEVSKPIVGEGYPTCFNITVESQGGYSAKFNVSAHANTTIIGIITNVTLASGESRTLTFTWNTSGFAKGNYTITVYATPLPNETDTTDNTLVADKCVCITIPGDVDGDFDVDLYDAIKLLAAYGVKKDNPKYDPNLDINCDGRIDLYDAVILLTHYGQKDP